MPLGLGTAPLTWRSIRQRAHLFLPDSDALVVIPRAPVDNARRNGYNGPSIMAQVTVYSKPGCHLCADAIRLLERLQSQTAFALQEINIQDDPALLAEYGEQIPVVLLNGEFLSEYTVDEGRLRQLLKEVN